MSSVRALGGWRATARATLALMAIIASWDCDYDHQGMSDRSRAVRLVPDSPEVRRLLIAERMNRVRKNETESPEQNAFVDAMTSRQTIEVPSGSYFRLLEWSEAVCTKRPGQNPRYIEVRVTMGSAKGSIGWACLGVDVAFTNAPP